MDVRDYEILAARTECDIEHVTHTFGAMVANDTRLLHAVIGMTGEVGELATAIERYHYYGHEIDRTNLIEELGDCLWYIAEACRALDVSIGEVMEKNIAKLRKRFPKSYDSDLAREENRNRDEERRALED